MGKLKQQNGLLSFLHIDSTIMLYVKWPIAPYEVLCKPLFKYNNFLCQVSNCWVTFSLIWLTKQCYCIKLFIQNKTHNFQKTVKNNPKSRFKFKCRKFFHAIVLKNNEPLNINTYLIHRKLIEQHISKKYLYAYKRPSLAWLALSTILSIMVRTEPPLTPLNSP